MNYRKIDATTCYLVIGLSVLLRLVFMSVNDLLVEEAYYWNYAQHLDFGYLDHPPMVALLIKLSTAVFGIHEFGVRMSAMFCWILTAFFSFKLSQLMHRGAGIYAVMLLSTLPFFFTQSAVITPDLPVMACWSATLYYLYRSLVLQESSSWYWVGMWLGLGMLSKYTIVLLGLPIFAYLCFIPAARAWFSRKEPYLALLIAFVIFTPVIYWNATHEWASFAFQSVRRFKSPMVFYFPVFFGLLLLFLTPIGLVGLARLFRKKDADAIVLNPSTGSSLRFIQLFTCLPLAFFALFSLTHQIKFDWMGPGLLAIIPWFAVLICHHAGNNVSQEEKPSIWDNWLITIVVLLVCYVGLIGVLTFGGPHRIYQQLFGKYFAWSDLSYDFYAVAKNVEIETGQSPIFVPLDNYNIASELLYYQAVFLADGKISKSYPVIGSHVFGLESLMYRYWDQGENLNNKTVIIISSELFDFARPTIRDNTVARSELQTIWAHGQRNDAKIRPYYYKIVTFTHR